MSKKTFYITTPIYYTSGNLHIGNAYTTIICDALARYKKIRGYDVYYLTGTDEHGKKVQTKAVEENKEPKAYVDELVDGIKKLWQSLNIDYNQFIRTTDEHHKENVQKIFTKLYEQGDIYLDEYEGWYCTQCEAFWTEKQLKEGKLCPDCGREVELTKEEGYFFKMSKYADQLVEYYNNNPSFIEPESRKREMINNFIKPGLEDLCISRTSFDWGIKIKENPKHVIYVWIDALANYISALGYNSNDESLYERFWKNDENHTILHVVGKEIVRFHVIYWPIMLLALGLPLPTKVFAHGWVIMKDGKMSKSVGNVVYPHVITDRYGSDALRYYLTTSIIFGQDGVFTPELFVDNFNADLVNNYGNLVSRTIAMVVKYFGGIVPSYNGEVNVYDSQLELFMKNSLKVYEENYDKYAINQANKVAFDLLSKGNKYIDDTKPWELAKESEKQAELASVMTHLVLLIKQATIMLQPTLVETSKKVFEQLGIKDISYDSILDFNSVNGLKVTKGEVIFPRLDPLKAVPELENAIAGGKNV